LNSFIQIPENSDFSIYNIPFGMAVINDDDITAVSRIGDTIIHLSNLFNEGYFEEFNLDFNPFEALVLNDFIELGKEFTVPFREKIQTLLLENSDLDNNPEIHSEIFFPIENVEMIMPIHVSNYTDFYSSKEHATNVGKMFRDPENALLPNWKHIPVGYHGRASSIIVSGIDIHRPKGQTKKEEDAFPTFGPTQALDFELEMAFITNQNTELGENISIENAENYIFGLCLFNDWSARDIQKWEYVPLGPFLSKNFASSISPWIVTLEALDFVRISGPNQEPKVLPYLQCEGNKNFDIQLEVLLQPENSEENIICKTNFKYMYWNMAQQLAHHSVNGCNIETCDLYASGTISGSDENSFGSMLELAWQGKKPLLLSDGSERKFILDNDTVIIRGFAEKDGRKVGFGEVKAKILPAK